MSNKIFSITIATLLVLLALAATSCQAAPSLDAALPPAPEKVASVVPTPAPKMEPPPSQTPNSAPAPDRQKAANALKIAGLSGGVVSANAGGTLTLRVGKQTQTIQTTASTLVAIPGKSDAQVADIHAGDRVLADLDASGTTATFLLVLPTNLTSGNILAAAVRMSRGGQIAVRTRDGNRVVRTDATTSVIDLSGDQPARVAMSDLQAGNAIIALGQASSDQFNAQVIIVLKQDARASLTK